MAQESTHRLCTGILRARGAVSFRGTVSFDTLPTGAVTAVAPPGAERHRFGCRLGRSTSSTYRPFHRTSFVVTPVRCMGRGGAQVRGGAGRGGARGGAVRVRGGWGYGS